MKYIRTKDGKIYEESKVFVVKENDVKVVLLGINEELVKRTRGKSWNCGTNVIVKESDVIKDLCDAFVVREKPFYLQPYLWKESVENYFLKTFSKTSNR